MIQDLKHIEYRRGMPESGMTPNDLPVKTWHRTGSPEVRTSIKDESMLNVSGVYGDKDVGDLNLTETWAQCFEALHSIPYEVGELVDRLADLYERVGPFFIESFHPGGDSGRCHQKRIRRLL